MPLRRWIQNQIFRSLLFCIYKKPFDGLIWWQYWPHTFPAKFQIFIYICGLGVDRCDEQYTLGCPSKEIQLSSSYCVISQLKYLYWTKIRRWVIKSIFTVISFNIPRSRVLCWLNNLIEKSILNGIILDVLLLFHYIHFAVNTGLVK